MNKINKKPCLACPFLLGDGVLEYTEDDYKLFITQLTNGVTKLCNTDPMKETACRGQRNVLLSAWYQSGKIESPTDEALAKYMRTHKIPVKGHILPGE